MIETINWNKWWRSLDKSGVETEMHMDEPVEQAPYMVTVQASHVSGDAALFDSEHRHKGFIALRIHSASRRRGLSSDWIHADQELIEVNMSESQWAAMISTLNHGRGVPATLNHILRQRVEQPKYAETRTEKFGGEMVKALERAISKIDAMNKGKLTKAQQNELAMIRQELTANVPYVSKRFDEHMEERVEKAKSDVEAYMNNAVQRAGLAAIGQSERLVKLLENKEQDE